jgi:hypothetical protein
MARISKKGIIVLSLIVISVTLVALFPANISPSITDVPTLDEEIEITTKLNKSDDISIEEEVSLDEKTKLEFYIDDKGTKHYVLDIRDNLVPDG